MQRSTPPPEMALNTTCKHIAQIMGAEPSAALSAGGGDSTWHVGQRFIKMLQQPETSKPGCFNM